MTEVRNRDMHFQSKNRTIEIWHRKGELMLPKDPVMLLSFVNMKLRDFYTSLDAPVSYTHLTLPTIRLV